MDLLKYLQTVLGDQPGKEAYDKIMARKDFTLLVQDPNNPTYVDKVKHDLVAEQLKTANETIKTRDGQIRDLEKSAADPEKLKTLEQTIKDLQVENQNTAKKYEVELKQKDFEYSIEKALTGKVHNTKAVKALLNLDALTVDKDNVLGLQEQLDKLKQSDGYLFIENKPDTNPQTNPQQKPGAAGINYTPVGGTGTIGNPAANSGQPDPSTLSFGARLAQKRTEAQKATEAQKSFFG